MDPTQNAALVIFAAVSPLLIAFVKQSGWSRSTNALIAFACYVIVGILGALLSGVPLTAENAVTLVTTVTVVGSAAYNLIWSNLGADENGEGSIDEKLTDATSVVS